MLTWIMSCNLNEQRNVFLFVRVTIFLVGEILIFVGGNNRILFVVHYHDNKISCSMFYLMYWGYNKNLLNGVPNEYTFHQQSKFSYEFIW